MRYKLADRSTTYSGVQLQYSLFDKTIVLPPTYES